MANLTNSAILKGKKVLTVMRRRELIFQTNLNYRKYYGLNGSIIMGSEKGFDPKNPIQICSIDTIRARLNKLEFLKSFDLIIIDECFSDDTEILTENGFVKFPDLKNEKVAQVEIDTKKIDFVNPIRKIKKINTGKMVSVESDNGVSVLATENHEMLITNHKGDWVKEKLKNVKNNFYTKVSMAGFGIGKEKTLSPFEKLLIAYQADGSEHYLRVDQKSFIASFSFVKKRKIKEFLNLMVDGNFNYKEVSDKKDYRRRFMVYLDVYFNKKINNYFKIKNLSNEKAIKIIEYMNIWDGHVASKNCYLFTTTDIDAANFYQSVCVLAGYKTKLKKVIDNRSDNFSDVYRLFITKKMILSTQSWKKTESSYRGFVYCVTVPKGNIVIRRNGKVLITGNCHDTTSPTYQKLFEFLGDKIFIGFTATPFRVGNKSLDFWQSVVKPIEAHELRDQGYLVPARVFAPKKMDLTGIKKVSTGDYNNKQLFEMASDSRIVGDIVETWKKYGRGATILFAVNIAHSKLMAHAFREAGIRATHIDQTHSSEERANAIKDLKDGMISVLTNVNVFSTGIDIAQILTIILARPTTSEILYVQQCGRGLRTYLGKDHCIILDHAGNSIDRFGLPYDIRQSSVTGDIKKKKETDNEPTVASRQCRHCFAILPGGFSVCPYCDASLKTEREIKIESGELTEISETPKVLLFNKFKTKLDQLDRTQKIKGFKKNWKYFKLYELFGKGAWEFELELGLPTWIPKFAENGKIQATSKPIKTNNIAFTKMLSND